MLSKFCSHSFLQLGQFLQNGTDGFLPETDRVRGLCNRQPGLGDALCRRKGLSHCPTSSYYVVKH